MKTRTHRRKHQRPSRLTLDPAAAAAKSSPKTRAAAFIACRFEGREARRRFARRRSLQMVARFVGEILVGYVNLRKRREFLKTDVNFEGEREKM